jgi:hypothetical protein
MSLPGDSIKCSIPKLVLGLNSDGQCIEVQNKKLSKATSNIPCSIDYFEILNGSLLNFIFSITIVFQLIFCQKAMKQPRKAKQLQHICAFFI